MDATRCVVIEFDGISQEALLKFLSKNYDSYNWILTVFDKIRVCVWWTKNVEFSTTPLRSFLKRFKSKMPIHSHLKISRKMTTQEGVQKVYNGNCPVMLTLDVLQQSSISYLVRPVRAHVIGLQLIKPTYEEPSNEEPNNEEPSNEEPDNKEPNNEEPSEETYKEIKVDDSAKLDLLLKITARIATQVKKLSQLVALQPIIEPIIEPDEVMEDTSSSLITHADEVQPEVIEVMDEVTPKPEVIEVMDEPSPKFGLSKIKYCNRDPNTGKCDGDPRGHWHPF